MFDQSEKKVLLQIARNTLENLFITEPKVLRQSSDFSEILKEKLGAFVTLKIEGDLRGCIGFIESKEPLYKTVEEAAILAATEDTRFPPLELNELMLIDIEISVLGKSESVKSYDDIILGEDGLILEEGFKRGLLLPQVPIEHGMNKEEYLTAICCKAGLNGSLWKTKLVNLKKFKAFHFSESELKNHGK